MLGSDGTPPSYLIYDLGKQSRKQIRLLKKREGKLVNEVDQFVKEQVALLGAANDKQIVPIVILYRQKRKSGKSSGLPLPLPLPFKF